MGHLIRLDQLISPRHCGGKGANLKKIRDADIPVPETLILKSTAMGAWQDRHGLREKVEAYLGNSTRSESLESDYTALREYLNDCSLDKEIGSESAIERLLSQSPYGVAVRSSAHCEDAPDASFAGVFESELGPASLAELEDSIRRTWCSLWSPRALRYMTRLGIAPAVNGMAVLMQPVLPAEQAGVMYTAEIASGNPFRLEVYCVAGLALDLMDGSGNGTRYLMDYESGELLDVDRGRQSSAIMATAAGVETRPADLPGELEQGMLDRLLGVGRTLDDRLGCRLEIEWVITGGEITVVQARPLVGLPRHFPVTFEPEEQGKTFELPTLVIPLRKDVAPNLITPLYDHFDEMEMWFRYHPNDIYFAGIRWYPKDVNGHRYCIREPDKTFLQSFQRDWARLDPWLEANEPRYRPRWDQHADEINDIVREADDAIANTSDAQALIPAWIDLADRVMDIISFGWSAPQCMGWMFEALFRVLMTRAGVPYELDRLVAGSDSSRTFLFTRDLQRFARDVDDPPAIEILLKAPLDEILPRMQSAVPGGPFALGFEDLCREHGKLPPGWSSRPPFWWDEPDALLGILHSIKQARLGREQDAVAVQRTGRANAERYRRRLKTEIRQRDPMLANRFDGLVDKLRVWTQALNDRHLARACWFAEKDVVWHLGTRMTGAGLLARPIDVLALRIEDLEEIAGLRDIRAFRGRYLERKAEYDHNRRYTPPAVIGRPAESPAEAPAATGQDTADLTGVGMSGSRVTGRARHVKNLYDAGFLDSLDAEDILVLPGEHALFYADWHSIFMLVKGVVSPGRPSHHLSQVARECGIPVIGYVKGDLQQIQDGAKIAIDPASGSIEVL